MTSRQSAADQRLGSRLRREREAKNLTQADLAHQLAVYDVDIHPTVIAKIESGARGVKLAEAVALAGVLGLTVEELVRPVDDEFEAAVDELREAVLLIRRGVSLGHAATSKAFRLAPDEPAEHPVFMPLVGEWAQHQTVVPQVGGTEIDELRLKSRDRAGVMGRRVLIDGRVQVLKAEWMDEPAADGELGPEAR